MTDAQEPKLEEIDLRKLTIGDILKLDSPALRTALAELVRRRGDLLAAIGHQNHGSHADHGTHSTDGSVFREPEVERLAERIAELSKRST